MSQDSSNYHDRLGEERRTTIRIPLLLDTHPELRYLLRSFAELLRERMGVMRELEFDTQVGSPGNRILDFSFRHTKCLNFDLKTGNYREIFSKIIEYPEHYFEFDIISDDYTAYGQGATRQVYHKLMNDMLGDILMIRNPYFIDINADHEFWSLANNIHVFLSFFRMFLHAGCLLPYHFFPLLLEKIAGTELTLFEAEFFLEKMDPELVNSIKKIPPEKFSALETGYDNPKDFYRDKLRSMVTDEHIAIYEDFAEELSTLPEYEILKLDERFSGAYKITAEMILSITKISDNTYQEKWNYFVRSLTEFESKQMLLTFGNTLSLNETYTIYIQNDMEVDIRIITCSKSVLLHQRVFDNEENMNSLRNYFHNGDDKICDHKHHPENLGVTARLISNSRPQLFFESSRPHYEFVYMDGLLSNSRAFVSGGDVRLFECLRPYSLPRLFLEHSLPMNQFP